MAISGQDIHAVVSAGLFQLTDGAIASGNMFSTISAGLFYDSTGDFPTAVFSLTSISPSSGVAGTAATVTCTNAGATQGNGAILISGHSLIVVSWSATSIVCTTPDGIDAGTYDVIGLNNAGTVDTLSSAFTVISSSNTADSIRKLLREAMKYQLATITAANGYRSSVRGVYDPIVNMEKIVSYPVIDLEWGDEYRSGDIIVGNRSMYDIVLPCTANCYLKSSDIQDAQDNLLADIQQLIGNNFYLTGSDGNRTAFIVTYEGASIGGIEAQSTSQPNGWLGVSMNCHYRILYSDPTVLG